MLEGGVWRYSSKSSIHKSNWERKIQPEDGLYSAHGRFVCDCEARNGISELNRNAVLQSVQRWQLPEESWFSRQYEIEESRDTQYAWDKKSSNQPWTLGAGGEEEELGNQEYPPGKKLTRGSERLCLLEWCLHHFSWKSWNVGISMIPDFISAEGSEIRLRAVYIE